MAVDKIKSNPHKPECSFQEVKKSKYKIFVIVPHSLFKVDACLTGWCPHQPGQPAVGLGTIIAVVISWSRNKSILWAIVHGILGWLYVIYAIFVKAKN